MKKQKLSLLLGVILLSSCGPSATSLSHDEALSKMNEISSYNYTGAIKDIKKSHMILNGKLNGSNFSFDGSLNKEDRVFYAVISGIEDISNVDGKMWFYVLDSNIYLANLNTQTNKGVYSVAPITDTSIFDNYINDIVTTFCTTLKTFYEQAITLMQNIPVGTEIKETYLMYSSGDIDFTLSPYFHLITKNYLPAKIELTYNNENVIYNYTPNECPSIELPNLNDTSIWSKM